MAGEKKGITVKIDADLHAEVRQYLEQHGMTMAEFVTLALDDELHPKHQQKEEQTMGNMRTLAFQVPEELFQRIKGYLARNNISQKQFVIGLIETELEREQTELESMAQSEAKLEGQDEAAAMGDEPDEAQDMGGYAFVSESGDETMTEDAAVISAEVQDEKAGEITDELEAGDEDTAMENEPDEDQDIEGYASPDGFEDKTMSEDVPAFFNETQSAEAGEFTDEWAGADEEAAMEDEPDEDQDMEGYESPDEFRDETMAEDAFGIPDETLGSEEAMGYEDEDETEYQGFTMGM